MIWLLFLHHIGDVAFQPSWLIANKHKHWWSIYEHVMVWSGLICFGLLMLNKLNGWKMLFLIIGHFIIDYFRYRKFTKWEWIYVDQALHYLQIAIVYYL